MILRPFRRIRELEQHVEALAQERASGWRQISVLEEQLAAICRANSDRTRKGNATRNAAKLAKAEELRRETAQKGQQQVAF